MYQFNFREELDEINNINDLLNDCLIFKLFPSAPQAIKAHLSKMIVSLSRKDSIWDNHRGEISDGYHTFDELYHHRAVLFSVICNNHPELAWKSLFHDDPNFPMYKGMFIVGIETPEGQATYHYDIDPYWNLFNVKILDRAPKYDGHTPDEAIRRISSLSNMNTNKDEDDMIILNDMIDDILF